MNLPNKLTMLRMGLIPVFLVFMCFQDIPHRYLWALLVFAAASFTDMLDGQIARKYNLVTNFGKFMDPLADKLLVMSALVCFTQTEFRVSAVVIVVILAREFAVTALRTLAADAGVVIAADRWGKVKTVSQMVWICYMLLFLWCNSDLRPAFSMLPYWMYLLAWLGQAVVVLSTLGSGINYLWKNRRLFLSSKQEGI